MGNVIYDEGLSKKITIEGQKYIKQITRIMKLKKILKKSKKD